MLTVPTNVDVQVTNNENQLVQHEYIEEAIQAAGIDNLSNGSDIKIITVQKPLSGTYTITITNNQQPIYSYTLFIYDNSGEVKKETLQSYTNKSIFTISYDKDDSQNSPVNKTVTFDTLFNELRVAFNNHLIGNGEYHASIALLKSAERDVSRHNNFVAKIKLQPLKLLFSIKKRTTIDVIFRQTFLQDLDSMISSL